MNKPFLLIAGDQYYPNSKTGDWKGCYASREEAENQIVKVKRSQGWSGFCIDNEDFDWYTIVDLREWVK